ncbi:MAG: hypothetical protein ACRCZ9_07175 [Fusobacteriaceae bacterium]
MEGFFIKHTDHGLQKRLKEVYPDIKIYTDNCLVVKKYLKEEGFRQSNMSAGNGTSEKEFFLLEISGRYFAYNNTDDELFENYIVDYEEPKGGFILPIKSDIETDAFLSFMSECQYCFFKKGKKFDEKSKLFYEEESLWEGGMFFEKMINVHEGVFEVTDEELIKLFKMNNYIYSVHVDCSNLESELGEYYNEFHNKTLELSDITKMAELLAENKIG